LDFEDQREIRAGKDGLGFIERGAEFFKNVIVSGLRQVVNPDSQSLVRWIG
jgi:hypothetical protein